MCYTPKLMFECLRMHSSIRSLRLGVGVAVGAAASLAGCGFEEPPLPDPTGGPDVYLVPDTRVVEDEIPRNATFAGLLAAHDMPNDVAYAFVEAMRPVFDPTDLQRGHAYRMVYDTDGDFRRFEYHVDDDQFLQVASGGAPSVFNAALVDYQKRREQVAMHGEIDSENNSLFAAMVAGGGDVQVAVDMAQVFSGEIDFNTELRQGDHFSVLYEQFVRDEVHVTSGDVLAATFVNDGRQVTGFRFEVPGEAPAYFDTTGRSMKRQFLSSPFRFERILASTTERRPVPRSSRCRRAGWCRPRVAAGRATWCGCVTPTGTKPTTCICRDSRKGCAGARRWRRGRLSGMSVRPVWRQAHTSTTDCGRTAPSSTR